MRENLLEHFTRLCTQSEHFGSSSVPLVNPLEMAGHELQKAPYLEKRQSRRGASDLNDKDKAICSASAYMRNFLQLCCTLRSNDKWEFFKVGKLRQ